MTVWSTDFEVNVQQTGRDVVSVLYGVSAVFVAAAADDAVRRVLESKVDQLAQYERAYLALVEPTGMVEPADMREAFERAVDVVPRNWLRVYMVTRSEPAQAKLVYRRE